MKAEVSEDRGDGTANAMGKMERWRRWLILAMTLCTAASLFVNRWPALQSAFGVAPPPGSSANQKYAITPHLTGLVLPSGMNAPCQKDFQKIFASWLNRTILAHFPADKDPKGAAYLRASLDYLAQDGFTEPTPDLVAQARTYDISTVTDAGLLLLIGIIRPAPADQYEALQKAVQAFPKSSYPKFIWFLAAANEGRAMHQMDAGSVLINQADQLSLQYLEAGLQGDSFELGEMSALRWRFDAGSFQDLVSRNSQKVTDIFQAAKGVEPWMKDYVTGQNFVDLAWKSRGSGWSNSVSEQGWKGFADNLAAARQSLTNAWNENPHDPGAAAEMITVCMGENEQPDTMRSWFDKSVAADFDYRPAYNKYVKGLLPRWFGTYAEMNAFGEECAATGRYDTMVPYERVIVAGEVSYDSEDHGAQFSDPAIADQVLTVLNKYFEKPPGDFPIQCARTFAAIIAHKAGRMDEVKRQLAAIHYKPLMSKFLMGLDDLPALVNEAQDSGSAH